MLVGFGEARLSAKLLNMEEHGQKLKGATLPVSHLAATEIVHLTFIKPLSHLLATADLTQCSLDQLGWACFKLVLLCSPLFYS